MRLQAILTLPIFALLGSCSTSYELHAFVLNGRIAFAPVDKDIWGNPDPDCFYSISVSIVDGPSAKKGPGESEGLIKHGTYWNKTFAVTSCENLFPAIYGQDLRGPPFRENYQYEVAAKPLVPGYVYQVTASSNGSAYGGGKFKLTKDGMVENLPQ